MSIQPEPSTEEKVYHPGYKKPQPILRQLDILKGYWPGLRVDGAIRYWRDALSDVPFPHGAEGEFAVIRPGYFSQVYEEELGEVLTALEKAYAGKFKNWDGGQRDPKRFRQNVYAAAASQAIAERQPGDVLVVRAQLGKRHAGRSPHDVRQHLATGEFGLGRKDSALMLLTNPLRLKHPHDLRMDCPGDECEGRESTNDPEFGRVPFFAYHKGHGIDCLMLGAGWLNTAAANCGSSTGWLA